MIKIVTDEFLDEMSEWLTPACQNEPCSDCDDVKRAVKREDIKQFRQLTNCSDEETAATMSACKQCLWFWVDEVEELDEEQPLPLEELREMVGSRVRVVVQYEHFKCDGWAKIITPSMAAYFEQHLLFQDYGKTWLAYRRRPEGRTVDETQP